MHVACLFAGSIIQEKWQIGDLASSSRSQTSPRVFRCPLKIKSGKDQLEQEDQQLFPAARAGAP